jgi:hypothetical protein
MVSMREHVVQWVTASPLWPTAATTPAVMQRPALLRFESDSFMDDLNAILASRTPADLTNHVATAKSYRAKPVGEGDDWQALPAGAPLKLYQPVHGHFCLVAATLVCRLPTLPDRALDAARDKVGFVLRRLDANNNEMAWSPGSDGSKGWQTLTDAARLAAGEEFLPMFPVRFTENNRQRRLLLGLIPTSSRDTFQTAPALPAALGPDDDPRVDEFDMRVKKGLAGFAAAPANPLLIGQQQDGSMFLLLDFADFLIKFNLASASGDNFQTGPALQNYLANTDVLPGIKWLAALQFAWANRHQINGESTPPLADPYNLAGGPFDDAYLTLLHDTVVAALGPYQPPAAPASVVGPKLDPQNDFLYVVRCAYLRPTCKPPHSDVLSAATEPFQIASFFDPDAPVRAIRIPMPVDLSLAGLRKFTKNVAFMTSKDLRNKISTISDKVLKGNLDSSAGFTLGEICSFSLPIITICAMIVLIVFVILLNIAFFWLPIFRICLPIPVKK